MRWLLTIAAILMAVTYCRAAEFYVSSYSKVPSWRQAAAHERVRFLLKVGGTDVIMHGEIKDGDFAQLYGHSSRSHSDPQYEYRHPAVLLPRP